MKKQPDAITQIAERLSHFPHVEKVVLFGSRARGDERERSDIDIAVFGPEITREEWRKMRDFVDDEVRTLLSIDLLRYEKATARLRESIENEGVTLYERRSTAAVC